MIFWPGLWAIRSASFPIDGKGIMTRFVQDAYFLCDTPDEAKAKYHELLDVLQHHDGVYLSKKAKKKLQTT
jgi:hypothetical protein